MKHTLIEELHLYFSNIGSPTEEEKSLLIQLTGELPYFKVTSVHRDDLRMEGFDASGVSDADMEELAKSLGKDYVNQLFWGSLKIIAGDIMNIPIDKNASCPKCMIKDIGYDDCSRQYTCKTCGQQWSDIYVLVEFPDDSSFFENNDIGYPCFNSKDNGARYVLEHDYLNHFQKEPPENAYFRPVQWPESQEYTQEKEDENEPDDSILALCELITDEETLEKFGSGAIWVPLCMINDNEFQNK